ncbi:hypothetical protein [Arthrobacter sp. Leaf69]|uniref:hypothetical protein n=1 Tax=Arthrobacter sp. Leaf69 TaxID=1736232 RepID=UPI0006F38F5E|nr:hypothetical protein [Arthrobacter sp. Leaf69]KQN86521.1 hypothetical protein ASE96_13205 [Arthrobacter sp. Leaf69]
MAHGFTDAQRHVLRGENLMDDFRRAGAEPWTVLYDFEGSAAKPISTVSYSVLAPPGLRPEFLDDDSWDVRVGHGLPGTITTFGQTRTTSYVQFGNDEGWEPLVIVTDGAGTRDGQVLLNQEFRLVFNLFEDKDSGNYFSVADDGSEVLVAEMSRHKVRVRSSYLARFRALKQLDLWLYTETHSHFRDVSTNYDFEPFNTRWKDTDSSGLNHVGVRLGYPTALFRAKKFLGPAPIEYCNLWEYEAKNERYEDFIIGEDEVGQTIRFTCEEDKLANYYGKNPEAPHYLTPVFFRSDVLQKYYGNPELYTVTDGSISCKGRWHLRMDNDHGDHVAVFLGDLGRDLPESERQYWRGFNVAPAGSMSSTYVRRSFLGQWVDAEQPDHQFKRAYRDVQSRWLHDHGWQPHRKPHKIDQGILERLHVPLNETQTEFEDQLLILAKLLVDFLNDKAIGRVVGKGPDNERSLGKLQRFFEKVGYDHAGEDLALLKDVQELRSRVAAHTKGSDYDKYIAGKLAGKSKKELIRDLHSKSTLMLDRWTQLSGTFTANQEA